jgi:hypothetical protein
MPALKKNLDYHTSDENLRAMKDTISVAIGILLQKASDLRAMSSSLAEQSEDSIELARKCEEAAKDVKGS